MSEKFTAVISRARNILIRQPGIIFWLILGYFILCVLMRIIRSDSLQNDEAEQAFLSQMLLLGYGRQPPLYDWLQIGMNALFGLSVATLSALKNILLLLCCIFYGLAARQVMEDRRLPLIAMLGLLMVPSISVLAQRDLTHAIATLCFVSLFLLAFLKTLDRPSLASYLLLGVTVGLGLLTKYNFVIIPIAAMAAVLPDPEFRKRLLDWRMIPGMFVAIVIALPHLFWALTHLDLATTGTVEAMREGASGDMARDRIRGLISIVLSMIEGTAPVLAIFVAVFFRDLTAILRASSRWTRVIGWMIVICLVLVALIGIGFGASSIRQKWLSPFQMLLPLYFTLKIAAAGIETRESVARMGLPVMVLITISVVYFAVANVVAPYLGRYSKEHTPYQPMLERVVGQRDERPSYILTDDLMMAGNARLEFTTVPVLMPLLQPIALADAMRRGPGLIVWPLRDGREGLSDELKHLLRDNGLTPESQKVSYIDVPYNFARDGDTMRFGYLWLEQAPLPQR